MKVFWILLLYNILVSQCYAVLTKIKPNTPSIVLDVVEDTATSSNLKDLEVDSSATPITWTVGDSSFQIEIDATDTKKAKLQLKAALDYETGKTKTFNIEANDGPSTVTWAVTINVKNAFDVAPTFTAASYTCDIDEGTTDSCNVISVSDAETSAIPADKITCTLSGAGSAKFSILSPSCTISLTSPIDYEDTAVPKTYTLAIKATDLGGNSNVAQVTINIKDKNDNAPICTPNPATATKSESYTGDVSVISCSDKDTGDHAKMKCSTAESRVAVTMSGTDCTLKINTAIDYDTLSPKTIAFNILVKDTDTDTSITKTTTVPYKLTISNEFDVAPTFTAASYTCNINEETKDSCSMISVSDIETSYTPADEITCTLTGTNSIKFSIASPSCAITPVDPIDYDTATQNTYTLTITATDKGGKSNTASITINILDVNDNAPDCGTPTVSFEKSEKFRGIMTTLSCTDNDSGENGAMECKASDGRITTTMSGNACTISIGNAIDYEGLTSNPIKFTVTVSDKATTNAKSKTFNYELKITNIFDVAPVFANAPYNCAFDEETTTPACTTPQVTDSEPADTIKCELSGTNSNYFSIDPLSCAIVPKNAIDYEDSSKPKTFNLQIKATDSKGNSNQASVSIVIKDKNDNAPVCTPNPATATKLESNTGITSTISCTDADVGNNALMTCSTTETRVAVSMSGNICTVRINTAFDYETLSPNPIQFNIEVKDSPTVTSETKKITVPYTLTIENAYDIAPKFTAAHYDCYIPEESTVPCTTPSVSDSEAGDEITCSLSGSYANLFNTYSPKCTTSLKAGIDYDTNVLPNNYSLTIKATDKGGTFSEATLNVIIGNINDNRPVCIPTYVVNKKKDGFTGVLSRIKCFDKDSGDFGQMICSTSESKVVASMSGTECIVSIKNAIDINKLINKTILFNIVVRDNPQNATTFKSTTIPYTLTITVDDWITKPEYIALLVLGGLLVLVVLGVSIGCCLYKSSPRVQDSNQVTSEVYKEPQSKPKREPKSEPQKNTFKQRNTPVYKDVNPYRV